jgi:hypothetical protein
MASILRKQLIHVRAGFGQVIQVIHHPHWALLIVPHEHVVETGLRHLRLCICQDHLMHHRGFLLENHLYRVFLHDDLLSYGSSRWRRSRGGTTVIGGVAASPPSSSSSSSASASSPMRSSPISLAIFVMSSSQDSTVPSSFVFSSFNF